MCRLSLRQTRLTIPLTRRTLPVWRNGAGRGVGRPCGGFPVAGRSEHRKPGLILLPRWSALHILPQQNQIRNIELNSMDIYI